jgi:endonuclease G
MAIVLSDNRPAFEVVDGSFETPGEPWAHLGDADVHSRLQAAIPAVARLEGEGSGTSFLGTAFVVAPDLVVTAALSADMSGDLFTVFDGVRIPVSEPIPLSVERVRCELLRVDVPDDVASLRLSSMPTDSLTGREIVVIGYPSSDNRNDPAVMKRVFSGVLDVKQVLPGHVTGLSDDGALQHDASTTGGCGGAPMIDVATGEVIGIHYAGIYLKTNLGVPAAEFVRDLTDTLDGVVPQSFSPQNTTETATETADQVELPASRQATIPEEQAPPVATVPSNRPAVNARDWHALLQGDWRDVIAPHQVRLDTAVRAVGRIDSGAPSGPSVGTAFLVGDRLALTASFIVQTFAEGSGLRATVRDGCRPVVDFSECLGVEPGSALSSVVGVRFIHPYFHVAEIELDHTPDGVTRLELASRLPADLSGRPVALVAYAHSFDPVTRSLLMQPGQARQVGELPDETRQPVLVHDCASGGGSAGGPVVDLGTGYVIGMHTHGTWGEGPKSGFAQPLWELARDPNMWNQDLGFRPNPRPAWMDRWDVRGATPTALPEPPPPTERWTVDDKVPIDWARDEPKELQRLLVATIDAEFALYEAENVGLQPGRVNRGQVLEILWRDLMKQASAAGVLRRLLEGLAARSEYQGIAPEIRRYL